VSCGLSWHFLLRFADEPGQNRFIIGPDRSLRGADLTDAELAGAVLDHAKLKSASVKGLNQMQLDWACGSDADLPLGLMMGRLMRLT
jgi:hypothetical protein